MVTAGNSLTVWLHGSYCLCTFLLCGYICLVSAAPSVNTIDTGGIYKSSLSSLRIIYPKGKNTESQLPTCDRWSVCNRVDTYSRPWVERMCNCAGGRSCSSSLSPLDGHTLVDRSRQYKICEPVDSLPKCRFFRDVTWTYVTRPDNVSQQLVHCVCPENSTPYISGHEFQHTEEHGPVYKYYFACSPKSAVQCMKKEPCSLFTVNKRYPIEEVTTSTLCQCPSKTACPRRHTDSYVLQTEDHKVGPQAGVRTYAAYCRPVVR